MCIVNLCVNVLQIHFCNFMNTTITKTVQPTGSTHAISSVQSHVTIRDLVHFTSSYEIETDNVWIGYI